MLVTGASRGIGRAVARALIDAGDRVALVARDHKRLEAVRSGDVRHAVLTADLTDAEAAEAVVDRAAEALGGLDGLVCAAGVVAYEAVGAIEAASLQRQLAVNTVAPFLMMQRAAKHMGRSGGGSIVTVASTLAYDVAPKTAAYATSKAALVATTRSFALELADVGIRVNGVAPGVVDTEMVRVPRLDPGEPKPEGVAYDKRVAHELQTLRQLHPLGRLGTPDEVAAAVLYLLGAEWVTGTVLTIDGGLSLR